jgi:hypothetical protein
VTEARGLAVVHHHAMRRQSRRRRLGIGLVAFGATGLGLVVLTAGLLIASFAALQDAATGFERQRDELLSMLGPASDALSEAARSASNAGSSLRESSNAATRAAGLTGRLADTFDGLAALGSFEIFGTRPFAGLSGDFASVGTEARALSTDLTTTAAALQTNVSDSDAVAADLRALSDQLAELESSIAPDGKTATGTGLPIAAVLLLLFGLLVWLAVPAVVSTWLGWRLLRRSSVNDRAASS